MPPTSMDPQFIEGIAVVQELSQYTPTFGLAAIEDVLWLAVNTATVKPDITIAAIVKTIAVNFNFEALAIAMKFAPSFIYVY